MSSAWMLLIVAGLLLALAAWRAPFPQKDDDHATVEGSASALVTVDDPTRLSAAERSVQRLAGQASIFAMLNILAILIIDAWVLGQLQGMAAGTGMNQFLLLLGSGVLKGFFSWRTFQLAGGGYGSVSLTANVPAAMLAATSADVRPKATATATGTVRPGGTAQALPLTGTYDTVSKKFDMTGSGFTVSATVSATADGDTVNGSVTNGQTGLCLDVNGAGTANGTAVIVWSCHGGANQRWARV